MAELNSMNLLLKMLADCIQAKNSEQVLSSAVRALPSLAGAEIAVLLRRQQDDLVVVNHEGADLPYADLTALERDAVPSSWKEAGIGSVEGHQLPGDAGLLVLAWRDRPVEQAPLVAAALSVLDVALARLQVEAEHQDLIGRVDDAQNLANMGDYDWHIASDTNRWSDQLYRIYGYEPQAFNASYDRFLEMLHPEDRERIAGIHQEAYRTGEPYQMLERIIRPDGQIRHLASNGHVLKDSDGTPLRFRGTCIDITERVLAEQEHEAAAARVLEHRLRRRQALEINDSVVQGLVAASYALQLDDSEQAATHLNGTLAQAQSMMDDLLEPAEDSGPAPGDLVRNSPARFEPDGAAASAAAEPL